MSIGACGMVIHKSVSGSTHYLEGLISSTIIPFLAYICYVKSPWFRPYELVQVSNGPTLLPLHYHSLQMPPSQQMPPPYSSPSIIAISEKN